MYPRLTQNSLHQLLNRLINNKGCVFRLLLFTLETIHTLVAITVGIVTVSASSIHSKK